MVQASNILGKRICASKMSLSFMDVKLVSADATCEVGYTTCSNDGGLTSGIKVCIPKSLEIDTCPVTAIHFIKSND